MSQFEKSFIIVGIMVLVLLFVIIYFFPGAIQKLNSSLMNVGIGEENIIQSNISAVEMFTNFNNEYRACKLSPAKDCKCDITLFSLPESYMIEISNNEQTSKLTLKNKDTNSILLIEDATIEGDTTFTANTQRDALLDMYDSGIDTSNFKQDSLIKLYKTNSLTAKSTYTSLMVQPSGDSEYSLLGVYKLDNIKTLFFYAPYNEIDADAEEQVLKDYNNLPKCSQADPTELVNYKAIIDQFMKSYNDCMATGSSCTINQLTAGEGQVYSLDIINSENPPKIVALPIDTNTVDESYAFLLEDGRTSDDACFKFYDGAWYWKKSQFMKKQYMAKATDICSYFISDYYDSSEEFTGDSTLAKYIWETHLKNANDLIAIQKVILYLQIQKKNGGSNSYQDYDLFYFKNGEKFCADCPDENKGFQWQAEQATFESYSSGDFSEGFPAHYESNVKAKALKSYASTADSYSIQEPFKGAENKQICQLLDLNTGAFILDSIFVDQEDEYIQWFTLQELTKKGLNLPKDIKACFYSHSESDILQMKTKGILSNLKLI